MFDIFGIGKAIASAFTLASSALGFLSPAFTLLVDGLRWFGSKFGAAVAVVASNLITLFLIVPLMVGSGYYGKLATEKKCSAKTITKLRTEYKFIPRKPEAKKSEPSFVNPLEWWK